jgi:hypothetical protein
VNGTPAALAGALARAGGVKMVSAIVISTEDDNRPPQRAHCCALAGASVAQVVQN